MAAICQSSCCGPSQRLHWRACDVFCYCCDGLAGRKTLSFSGEFKESEGKSFLDEGAFPRVPKGRESPGYIAKPQTGEDENWWWMNDADTKPISALCALNNKECPGCMCKMLLIKYRNCAYTGSCFPRARICERKLHQSWALPTQLCNFGAVIISVTIKHQFGPACLEPASPGGYTAPSSAVRWFCRSGQVLLIPSQSCWGDAKFTSSVWQHGEGE